MDSEDIGIHIKNGDVYKKVGSIELSISEYQKALKIDITNPQALHKLGQAYEIKGDIEKENTFFLLAQDAYEKALSKEPNNPEIYNSIISLGIKQERIDELVKQCETKLVKDSNNAVLIKVVKELVAISLLSIPPLVENETQKGGCAKNFLDYVFPFCGVIPLLLGTMIARLKILQLLGIMILAVYLIYKFLTAKKSSKYKKW
ncbi:MAG: tetratricopeptide repeat protein [Elusimicrobiota bacterium]